MLIAFRTDASLEIGTGHVMRCLTLADALKETGASCHFLCRAHPGDLAAHIGQRGHTVHMLPAATTAPAGDLPYAAWLDCSWREDAAQSRAIFDRLSPQWFVVDHYALDAQWEKAARPDGARLLVIDDLADRHHACDLLLDQNLGRRTEDYRHLVPAHCQILAGSHYALLRPEFKSLRDYSLKRREVPRLKRLLVTLGGADKDNTTGKVVEALTDCALPGDCTITIVMGFTAPWLDMVKRQASRLRWPVDIQVNVADMAQLMADSDLAIGAAGATSWERCCVGLPSLIVVLAENQDFIARSLHAADAAFSLGAVARQGFADELQTVIGKFARHPEAIRSMSEAARRVTDGQGTLHVAHQILERKTA